jgi:hypothetical protein
LFGRIGLSIVLIILSVWLRSFGFGTRPVELRSLILKMLFSFS